MGLAVSSIVAATTLSQFIQPTHAYIPCGPFIDVKNCLTPVCPDVNKSEFHPRVHKALEEFSYFNSSFYERYFSGIKKDQEYLRFHKFDKRDKSLFISAEYDHNGALDPKYLSHIINMFGQDLDVKYAIADSVEKICEHIKEAAETGKLTSIIIHAHGNSKNIVIAKPGTEEGTLNEKTDFEKCFSGLAPTGKIILLSANTGDASDGDPIAKKMATISKREVIAPTETVFSNKVDVSNRDNLYIFHPSKDKSSQNIFKLYRPIYKKCQQIFEDKLHPREKIAIDSIKENLIQKSLISDSAGFEATQEYLRFCADDPKEKLLFLSGEDDWNGALYPHGNKELFGTLADHFDIKYKVVSSYKEICDEIRKGSKLGKLGNVILHAHGNREGVSISTPYRDVNNWIHMSNSKDWSKCFDGVDPAGKIILLSCETGMSESNNPNDNIAGLISKISKKTVVAPDELLYTAYVKVTEKDTVELFHPKQGFFERLFKNPRNILNKFTQ